MRFFYFLIILIFLIDGQAEARDDLLQLPFDEAVTFGRAENILDPEISFFLNDTSHPATVTNFSQYKSNKKTNAFGKSDEKACRWALLSALKSFQDRARSLDANAIINIKSNYKNREYSDPELYQCGAGAIMAGVALKADVAKLE